MADLVNATHKERLAKRDSEPTHLNVGGYIDLGGTQIDSPPNSIKIDGGKGIKGQDTSIIGAGQLSEPSHLHTEGEDDDVEVKFDGDKDDDHDDIDKELDEFEDMEPVDVDVDADDDKKYDKVHEEFGGGEVPGGEERGDNEGNMEKNASEPREVMNSGNNKVTGNNEAVEEGELPPWLAKFKKGKKSMKEDEQMIDPSKSGDEYTDINKDMADASKVTNSGPNDVTAEDEEIIIKGKGDEGEKREKSERHDDDDEGGEKEKKPNPFAKKEMGEAVTIHIKRPNVKLLEAAGIPAKSQKKVALIFETVVKDVTKQVATQMHRHYRKLHEEKLARRDAILTKQMDAYLSYVVEDWVKNNRIGIRTALKSQLAEEFLAGFQKLMKEHYIEVPESKVDVVKELSNQVTRLKRSLTEQTAQKLKLRGIAEAANKARIVSDFGKKAKLSESQSAKLDKLTESVQYTNAKDFREKLGMLAESYFGIKKPVTKVQGTEDVSSGRKGVRLTEEKIEDVKPGTRKTSGDPDIDLIAATLAHQKKLAEW